MSNQFIVLPVPSVSGAVGTSVDTSGVGASKTIIVVGSDPIGLAVVEGSNDGVNFAPVTNISLNLSPITIVGPFAKLRARRLAGSGSLSAVIGAEVASCSFVALPNDGSNADSSSMGPIKTVVLTGSWKGSVVVQGSNDGVHFDPVGSANAGASVVDINGVFDSMRLETGSASNVVGLTASLGAAPESSGGGGSTTGSDGVTVALNNATNDLVTGTTVADVNAVSSGGALFQTVADFTVQSGRDIQLLNTRHVDIGGGSGHVALAAGTDATVTADNGNVNATATNGRVDIIAGGGDIGLAASQNLTSLSKSVDIEVNDDNGGGIVLHSQKGAGSGHGDISLLADRHVTVTTQDVAGAHIVIHSQGVTRIFQLLSDGTLQAVGGAALSLTLQNDAGAGLALTSSKGGGAGNGDINLTADPTTGTILALAANIAMAGSASAVLNVSDDAGTGLTISSSKGAGAGTGDIEILADGATGTLALAGFHIQANNLPITMVVASLTGGSTIVLAAGTGSAAVAGIAAGDFVVLCRVTQGAAPGFLSYVITPGVGFAVTSSNAGDDGHIDAIVVRPTLT